MKVAFEELKLALELASTIAALMASLKEITEDKNVAIVMCGAVMIKSKNNTTQDQTPPVAILLGLVLVLGC